MTVLQREDEDEDSLYEGTKLAEFYQTNSSHWILFIIDLT